MKTSAVLFSLLGSTVGAFEMMTPFRARGVSVPDSVATRSLSQSVVRDAVGREGAKQMGNDDDRLCSAGRRIFASAAASAIVWTSLVAAVPLASFAEEGIVDDLAMPEIEQDTKVTMSEVRESKIKDVSICKCGNPLLSTHWPAHEFVQYLCLLLAAYSVGPREE